MDRNRLLYVIAGLVMLVAIIGAFAFPNGCKISPLPVWGCFDPYGNAYLDHRWILRGLVVVGGVLLASVVIYLGTPKSPRQP